jgi:hypothetical protein
MVDIMIILVSLLIDPTVVHNYTRQAGHCIVRHSFEDISTWVLNSFSIVEGNPVVNGKRCVINF